MSLSFINEPEGAMDALLSGLIIAVDQRSPSVSSLLDLYINTDEHGSFEDTEIEVTGAHPVFTVHADDIGSGSLLDSAQLVGWRYLILKDDKAILSATVVETDGKMELGSINQGRLLNPMLTSLKSAEEAEETQHEHFEIRYIELRQLHFSAIWLHGGSADYIVPIEDIHSEQMHAHTLQAEQDVIGILVKQQLLGSEFPEPP